MNKFGVVLSHTYFTRLKSKAFIITTALALLVMVLVANIDKIIDLFQNDEVDQIAVIDESNELLVPLNTKLTAVIDDLELVDFSGTAEEGKAAVSEEEYVGFLQLEYDENELPIATYYTNKAGESQSESMLVQQLQQLKTEIATEQAGVNAETLDAIFAEVAFEKVALDETAKTEEELNQTRGIVYVMLFVLYMTIIIYGQMIATDVATEKSSRVMELLISSASPVTHMFAKILGIAFLGLTQVLLLFVVGYGLLTTKLKDMSGEVGEVFEVFGFSDISINIYLYAILFFVLGYFLYATIAAMLGSLVSRVEDVSQLLLPMIFLIMIAFFIAMFGLGVPDATFITVTSFIPFFSPMIMFLRVGMLDVPIWEVIVSVLILVGTIGLLGWLGSRIYRGGVLMYGPSRSLKDFKQAFLLSKKEK